MSSEMYQLKTAEIMHQLQSRILVQAEIGCKKFLNQTIPV
jgi:hypothetical protein